MRHGLDRATGRPLSGWEHCLQSIVVILTTVIGQCVMLRDFGSAALDMQDRRATPLNIMRIYADVAAALRRWEPGYRLRTIQIVRYGPDGVFAFMLTGVFYPRGHLGDYSISEEREAIIAANDNGFRVLTGAA